jgi:hypothetical protein
MKLKTHHTIHLLLIIIACSCAHQIKRLHLAVVPEKLTTTIQLPTTKGKSFEVLYFLCGHIIIKQNNEAFFLDPFFTIQPIAKLPFGKMKSKTKAHDRWRETIKNTMGFESVQAGLVSHSHYDHLMDLPTMLCAKDFPNLKTVYGNDLMPQMLQNYKNEGVLLEPLTKKDVYDPFLKQPADTKQLWRKLTDNSRFLAIETHHAPQALGHLFMSGKFREKRFQKHLKPPSGAVGNFTWTVGTSYAFLVDMLSGNDTIRLYIQTSASKGPDNGMPPPADLKQKKVDLMILCYASTPGVELYPQYLIDKMKEGKNTYPPILMVHWEDFFKARKKPKLVALTNPGKTRARWMEALHEKDTIEKYITMPRPGTLVTVKY